MAGAPQTIEILDHQTGQGLCLRGIGSEERRTGDQEVTHRSDRLGCQQTGPALGHHDRVDHQRPEGQARRRLGHRHDDGLGGQHADRKSVV